MSSAAMFAKLMLDLFQLEEAESLDFGIYRIIKNHNREVRDFIGEIKFDHAGIPSVSGGALGAMLDVAFSTAADEEIARLDLAISECLRAFGIGKNVSLQDADMKLKEHEALPVTAEKARSCRDLIQQRSAKSSGDRDRAETLNYLYRYFERHYQDGDFIVQRRYSKDGARLVRSTGDDTEFHWATEGMYYIKSGDVFADFPCQLTSGQKFTLTIDGESLVKTRAELKPNDRARYVFKSASADQEGRLIVVLDYIKAKGGGKDRAEDLISVEIAKHLVADEKEVRRCVRKYMARNQSDFFIHKRLGAALRVDLDIYIKTDVLNADALLGDEDIQKRHIRMAKVVRDAGQKIIEFLAALENFQKTLWEKKKLVMATRYIITLDRLYRYAPTWLAKNIGVIIKAQRQEWKDLGLGDYAKEEKCKKIVTGDLVTEEKTLWLPLPVDTALFDEAFKWSMLEAVSANVYIDDAVDGVAIWSDNWQALNTLQAKYREQVKCCYIDPPYNTGGDGFPYKDAYKHSSWITMIGNRLELARNMMPASSAIYVSIDENERDGLTRALNAAFGEKNRAEEIIWGQNTTKNQSPTFSTNHEYIPVYAKSLEAAKLDKMMFRESKPGAGEVMDLMEKLNPDYPSITEIEKAITSLYKAHVEELKAEFEESGIDYESKLDPWKGLYNYGFAEYRDADGKYVPETEARASGAKIWVWREGDSSMPKGGGTDNKKGVHTSGDPDFRFYTPLHPVTKLPCPHPKRGWGWPEKPMGLNSSFEEMVADNRIFFGDGQSIKLDKKTKQPIFKIPQTKKFLHEVDTQVAQSVVLDYTDGEKELTRLFGKSKQFPNPKPTTLISRFVSQASGAGDWVMDFFGGSGTTWQAVANANRDERAARKTILVEAGDHFDNILMKRVKKVAFSSQWNSGAPTSANGPGLFMRAQRLEQYEDTLENLSVSEDYGQSLALFRRPEEALAYRLNRATRDIYLNHEKLRSPFGHTLLIVDGEKTEERAVDMLESFAYLLGMDIHRFIREDAGVLMTGKTRRDETVSVLFRDMNHALSTGWVEQMLKAFPANRVFTNSPGELSFEGVEVLEAIEDVFRLQFGKVA